MPIVRASYALRRLASVTYALKEGPVWQGTTAIDDTLRLLLEGRAALGTAGASSAAVPGGALDELLVTQGFERIASQLSERMYRVVIARGATGRLVRLTPREFDVARLAALGWSSRRIGIQLGVAGATVRGALERAVSKLDLVAAIQLPLLWHTLGATARLVRVPSGSDYLLFECTLPSPSGALTQAETALVERLLLGESYRSIAAHRRVSVRTVANQLSRLYDRLGVSNRVELVARVLAGAARSTATDAESGPPVRG